MRSVAGPAAPPRVFPLSHEATSEQQNPGDCGRGLESGKKGHASSQRMPLVAPQRQPPHRRCRQPISPRATIFQPRHRNDRGQQPDLGIRQGSFHFFDSRLRKAGRFDLQHALQAGNIELFGGFLRSSRLFRFDPILFQRNVNFGKTPGAATVIP